MLFDLLDAYFGTNVACTSKSDSTAGSIFLTQLAEHSQAAPVHVAVKARHIVSTELRLALHHGNQSTHRLAAPAYVFNVAGQEQLAFVLV